MTGGHVSSCANFTLKELQVLVKALRDGIAGDLKVALHLRDWELSGNHEDGIRI
jgi:hypothetical protein